MIHITFGNKNVGTTIERVDASVITLSRIFEMLESPDLFGEVKTYMITRVDDEEQRTELFERLLETRSYAHRAIVVLDKLLAAEKRKIEDAVTSISETKDAKQTEEKKINPFSLGNAIATGDKKQAWIIFSEIMHHDSEIEKTHGLVWWKVKEMLMKKNAYSQQQVIAIARELVAVYHESRNGGMGMKERLEHFLLTLPTPDTK